MAAARRQVAGHVEYDENWKPVRAEAVVISTQHAPDVDNETIETDVREHIIGTDRRPNSLIDSTTKVFVNPSGRFVIGGPRGDAGLTGRKIIVDTYGGDRPSRRRRVQRQGPDEGRPLGRVRRALGGEEHRRGRPGDPLRVHALATRSAWPSRPRSASRRSAPAACPTHVDPGAVRKHFDLRPGAIIRDLDLRRPIYRRRQPTGTSAAIDLNVPWEDTARAKDLRASAGL